MYCTTDGANVDAPAAETASELPDLTPPGATAIPVLQAPSDVKAMQFTVHNSTHGDAPRGYSIDLVHQV